MDSTTSKLPVHPQSSRLIKAALRHAAKGVRVFPCKPAPDKSPLTQHGFKDASTDRGRVHAFWTQYPGASIGIPTGERFWILDVDLDPAKGIDGYIALADLERKHGKLPDTYAVRTPRGGLHFYFKPVEGVTLRKGTLPDGIDVRGRGGYVLVPPSPGYTVENKAAIADAPEWLLEALRTNPRRDKRPKDKGSTPTPIAAAGGPIPEGSRNITLTSKAGTLHDGTRDLAQLTEDLLKINTARCVPPLSEAEVEGIAASIHSKAPCKPTRTVTPEVLTLLDLLEEYAQARVCKGMGARSRWAVYRALIAAARLFGRKVRGGVEVSISIRDLALAAGVSTRTLLRALDKLRESGLLRRTDSGRGTNAGSLTLVASRALWDRALTGTTQPLQGLPSSGDSLCPIEDALYRLRWGAGRIGKSKAAILEALAHGGVWGRKALAEAIGLKPETIRVPLRALVKRGLVERVGHGLYRVPDNFAEILWRETESDREAEDRDRNRYDLQRKAYRDYLGERTDAQEPDGYTEELEHVEQVPEPEPVEPNPWPDPYLYVVPPPADLMDHSLACECVDCTGPPVRYAHPPGRAAV